MLVLVSFHLPRPITALVRPSALVAVAPRAPQFLCLHREVLPLEMNTGTTVTSKLATFPHPRPNTPGVRPSAREAPLAPHSLLSLHPALTRLALCPNLRLLQFQNHHPLFHRGQATTRPSLNLVVQLLHNLLLTLLRKRSCIFLLQMPAELLTSSSQLDHQWMSSANISSIADGSNTKSK